MSRRVVSDRVKHADLVQHELVFLKYFRSREESWSSMVTWETSYNQQRNQKPHNLVLLESALPLLYITASSRGCLFAWKQTITKRYSAQPSSLELLSSHIVLLSAVHSHICSRLQGSSAYCFLYRTGQDAHALCSQSLGWEQSRDNAPTQ